MGFCLGFKVSGCLGFVLCDFWVSRYKVMSERRSVASLVCFFCLRSLGLFFVVGFQGFWVFGFCSS